MWKGLLLAVVLLAVLLPLSSGVRRSNSKPQNVCSLGREVGRCRAHIKRYFYNSKAGQCQLFYYGGCGGNGNNFETLSQCQRKCMSRKKCPVKGQVFSSCASPCKRTCDNVGRLQCATVCKPGCKCPGGQVIDTKRNRCVPIRSCPSKTKPGKCPVVPTRKRWFRPKWRCVSRCRNDSQCTGKKKCCRGSCGRVCRNPTC